METKRTTLLAVALAVAMITLAGVGYASVSGYKATVEFTGNDVYAPQYITIAPGTNVPYTGNFSGTYAFDTTNHAGNITFDTCLKANGNVYDEVQNIADKRFSWSTNHYVLTDVGAGTHDAAKIGSITVQVDFTNSAANSADLAISVPANQAGSLPTNGAVLGIVFTYSVGTSTEETVFDFSNPASIEITTTVTLNAYLVFPDSGKNNNQEWICPVTIDAANTDVSSGVAFNCDVVFVATVE